MEEIKVIDTKVITDNSKVVLLSIGGVKYIFTEAHHATYSGAVSIHTNLVKL
nr:MAG TPA: hypothetical protein [Caudoviricetes sp.]